MHAVVWWSILNRNEIKEKRLFLSSSPSFFFTLTTCTCSKTIWVPPKTFKLLGKVSHSCKYAAAQMCKQLRCSLVICAIVCGWVRHHGFYNLVCKKKRKRAEVGNVVMSQSCRCGCHSSAEQPQAGLVETRFLLLICDQEFVNVWWCSRWTQQNIVRLTHSDSSSEIFHYPMVFVSRVLTSPPIF